jgi:hypothetical protein
MVVDGTEFGRLVDNGFNVDDAAEAEVEGTVETVGVEEVDDTEVEVVGVDSVDCALACFRLNTAKLSTIDITTNVATADRRLPNTASPSSTRRPSILKSRLSPPHQN